MATKAKTTVKPAKRPGRGGVPPPEAPKPFTKENQPAPELKKEGWAKKKRAQDLVKAILDLQFKGKENSELKAQAAAYFGVPVAEITIEMMIVFRQAEAAIQKGDTQAANFIMDRAFGKPKQESVVRVNDLSKLPVNFE